MRGKERTPALFRVPFGITPAYAGKSCSLWSVMLSSPDHPRLCGEKFHLPNGSRCRGRITPAYAGKRINRRGRCWKCRDHPRLCGEKRSGGSTSSFVKGSPPPMRGKAAHYTGGSIECRITPAYAGKRQQSASFSVRCQDHPRLCGEKFLSALWKIFWTGSPPPMRGKDGAAVKKEIKKRITPAYAGKRWRCSE